SGLQILTPQGTHAGVSLSNASAITLQRLVVATTPTAPGPAVAFELTGVAASSLIGLRATGGAIATGIAMDAATTGVVVRSAFIHVALTPAGNAPVDVAGSRNTLVDDEFAGGIAAGLVLDPGAADNTVVNDLVELSRGVGIDNSGATGTAITNNRVIDNCATGIRVRGASSGVSVQNNVTFDNGTPSPGGLCPATAPPDAVEIGLYDNALGHTVVDYNDTFLFSVPGSSLLVTWLHLAR